MYKVKKYNDYNKIIWIHGLPGSGKSTLAEKIRIPRSKISQFR